MNRRDSFMNCECVEKELMDVFNENGLFIDNKDLPLQEYFPDSLTFVNIIVGVEDAFEIELPDEMLVIENLGTFNTLLERINLVVTIKDASNN